MDPEVVKKYMSKLDGMGGETFQNLEQAFVVQGQLLERSEAENAQLRREVVDNRHSLAQEIAGGLKARGLWVPSGDMRDKKVSSDLITAVAKALDGFCEENERLKQRARYAEDALLGSGGPSDDDVDDVPPHERGATVTQLPDDYVPPPVERED